MEIVRALGNPREAHHTHQGDLSPFHLQSCPLQVPIRRLGCDRDVCSAPCHRLDNEIKS